MPATSPALENGTENVNRKPVVSWRAALTAVQVRQIRRLYETKKWSQPKLARKFGVSQTAVSNILLRKTYRRV